MKPYKWTTPQLMIEGKSIKHPNGCWIWKDYVDKKGYSNIQASIWGKFYKVSKGHQLSYIIYNGEYDRKLLICHACNNPSCVNPNHLYPGTNQDNMGDKILAGSAKGSRNPQAKLTEFEIRQIRDLLTIFNNVEIASLYNVNARAISDIKVNRTWRHVV